MFVKTQTLAKKNKVWLLYAYCPKSQEIVAYVFGDRSEKTIKELYAKLAENKIIVDEFCTDNWKAFAKILPKNKHKIGKKYTKILKEIITILGQGTEEQCEKLAVFRKS